MTKSNLVLSVRSVVSNGNGKAFGAEPGPSRFLDVPDGETPHPERHRISRAAFRDEVLKRARTGTAERKTAPNRREAFTTGNVLVFVHGYNNRIDDIMERHNLLQAGLGAAGYEGAIVSFDWPSDDSTLNYLEDRRDAKTTAFRLVDDGIKVIAALQKETAEAQVRDRRASARPFDGRVRDSRSVLRCPTARVDIQRQLDRQPDRVHRGRHIRRARCPRTTASPGPCSVTRYASSNYSSRFDRALKISNVKRLGTAPRVGRVGLPADAHSKCVDVDCSAYWSDLPEPSDDFIGDFTHSWHFGDPRFAEDLAHTLEGDIDRHRIPTRRLEDDRLVLHPE